MGAIKKKYVFLIILVLFSILFLSRLKWMDLMYASRTADIKQGTLDLQDWEINNKEYFFLDGEWEFYPNQFLYGEEASEREEKEYLSVPKPWNDLLADNPTPIGYGTYRLNIQLQPGLEEIFAIYVSSIRSASEVYINGELQHESGVVATEKTKYKAENLPFSLIFNPDDNGSIEIVIQAANYNDLRDSGIIRSMKFGTGAAILTQKNFSIIMQAVTVIIFLIMSLYLLVFYFIGKRDRRILCFSVFLMIVNFLINSTGHEKVIQSFLQLSYEQSFRYVYSLLPVALYLLLESFTHRDIPVWRKIYPYFNIGLFILFLVTMLSPFEMVLSIVPLNLFFTLIIVVIAIILLVKNIKVNFRGGFPFLLAFLVLMHDTVWTIYWREIGLSVVYYPFDLIISAFIFTTIWFLDYIKTHKETEALAHDLKVINDGKTQFLANTAHEFKNPLNAILNMTHAVIEREKPVLQEKSIQELNIIKKVGRRMDVLLDDLIDEASLESGKPKLKRTSIDLRPIVWDVIDLLASAIEEKKLKVDVKISNDFPYLYADENRVTQILFNLLHNAVKYTMHGSITIQTKIGEGQVFISIIDSGIGIEATQIENIFTSYDRLTNEFSGAGLGLNVTKELVELHDGEVSVVSTLGQGSIFTFSLPISDTAELKVEEKESTLEDRNPALVNIEEIQESTKEKRPRLLVVDDNPVNLQVLQTILDEKKYDVSVALSGKNALKRIKNENWNLIISDVRMHHMSGYELTREIRAIYSKTELPIILVTANSNPLDLEGGFLAGANDYVKKPIEAIELRSRVDALVDMKEMVNRQLQLESAWLQAQIYPHFIFNTLNTISALNELDSAKLEELLREFSTFLRSKYQYYNIDELIPLQDELNIVKSYLNIEKFRFGDRLEVKWKIDIENESQVKIPFLSIQPLVENAVHHGIMKKINGGIISIEIKEDDDKIHFSVMDNGTGIAKEKLATILDRNDDFKMGIGLKNTNQRIKRLFGNGITIRSELNEGTKISFSIDKI